MSKYLDNLSRGAGGFLYSPAKSLRLRETEAEKILWTYLSNKKLGAKFRRQHPLKKYVVDFYCHSLKLVIEVDEGIHLLKENIEKNRLRTKDLQDLGLQVIRFSNEEVFNNVDGVVARIKKLVDRDP